MLQTLAISSFSPKYHPYVQHSRCVKTYQPPVTHIHGVLNRNQRKKYAIKCLENSFYPTNRITERNDVVCKPFNNNDRVTAVKLRDGNASKSEDGDESPKNVFLKNLNALYRFIYPYAFFGVLLATTSNSLLPVEKLADLTPTFFLGLLKLLVTSVLMNIYVPAVNQVTDVEIDKSLASAIMLRSPPLVLGVILWLFIATAYSAPLPFLRWKGNSFLAAVCAVFTCGLLPQVPFFFHVQKYVLGRPMEVTKPLMFASAFMTCMAVSIAFVKDLHDVEGDREHGIQTLSVILGKEKVLWLSVYMLSTAYGAAVLVGASSSFLLSKLVTKYVLGRPMEVTKPLMFASAFMTCMAVAIAFVKDLHDVEGDREHGIQTLGVILGKEKVLWLSVYMLSTAYGAAVLVGASSSFLLSKLVTIIGHATLLSFLWHRARNVDLSNNASIFSFYMFIWQAIILCRIPPYSFCTLKVNEELDVPAVGSSYV
ncbi:homogentisate geranylgeranyltransferase [Citrus sinensis]|nr:homogentisate geranylgeranyltransferase [Citrus sinensis]